MSEWALSVLCMIVFVALYGGVLGLRWYHRRLRRRTLWWAAMICDAHAERCYVQYRNQMAIGAQECAALLNEEAGRE